jgi:hypothetical protein
MNTKIVYVLVSNEHDFYLEQTLLSVYSAKIHMPNVEIILLVDNLTDVTINGLRSTILDYITSKIVVEIDGDYTNQQRSRILKTSIIEHVKGDFLFIDSDTIITSSLEEVDSFDFDIGAVRDIHISLLKKHSDYLGIKNRINKIGGLIDEIDGNMIYFNSGVIYVKDNDKTRIFFNTWNACWRKGNLIGINTDQTSFMIANILNNQMIHELSGTWNCQICWGLKYLYKSKIIHYFTSSTLFDEGYLAEFTSKNLCSEIKIKGYVDDRTEQILKNPYNYFSEHTYILYGRDIPIWNSYSVGILRYLHTSHNKLFNIIEFFSKCAKYYRYKCGKTTIVRIWEQIFYFLI